MTTETVTVYAVNETGLAEIREYLERFSKYGATDRVVNGFATDAEQSLSDSGGVSSSMEIHGFYSKSNKAIPFDLSPDGWDAREEALE